MSGVVAIGGNCPQTRLTQERPLNKQLSARHSTTQFFRDAGLTAGMHVLDVGCSTEDVSILAARLVA
jgi:hypothetical protein